MDNNIIKLEFPDVIRRRPGMYVESLETPELIVREVIDNAIDEVLISKVARHIDIHQHDGKYLVADDGRGFPINYQDQYEMTSAVLATSNLHAGSKFEDNKGASIGQNGVGIKATNALSTKFILMSKITKNNYKSSIPEVKSSYDDKVTKYYLVEYNRGILVREGVTQLSELSNDLITDLDWANTIVYFEPDHTMFESVDSDIDLNRFKYLTLVARNKLGIKDEINVYYNGKLQSKVDNSNYQFSVSGTFPFYSESEWTSIQDELKDMNRPINKDMWYNISFSLNDVVTNKTLLGSVNTLSINSGIHINVVDRIISRMLGKFLGKDDTNLNRGINLEVIVSMSETIFGSQSKKRLTQIPGATDNSWDRFFIQLYKQFKPQFDNHREEIVVYSDKIDDYNVANENLSKRKLVKSVVKHADSKGVSRYVSDKLIDCTTKDRKKAELFLTEGNSAGGTIAKMCDSSIHAVLPLRGRPFNSVRMDIEDVVKNTEMLEIINSIGSGVDLDYNIRRCRYGKIIIAADAD